jgi:SAM-dependent methyltransferase
MDVPFTGRYGIEAPYYPAAFGLGGAVLLAAARSRGPRWLVPAAALLGQTALYLHTTLRGKHVVWGRELDRLGIAGDERLLDVGCGSGAVLVAAARRLPRGRVEGVDLWRSRDQSGNDPARTRENAHAYGVADRIRLHTADMTELPFPDGSFDVVTSALAVHNISNSVDRRRAVAEMARVLKPGGRLMLVDILHVSDYARVLTDAMSDLDSRSLGINYWYGAPWLPARMLTGTRR